MAPPSSSGTAPFTCSLHAGDVLGGRYQIRARMGMGGYACLFLGEDLVTGQEVAIKAQVEREGLNHNALKVESEMLAKVQGRFAPRLLLYSAGGETLPSTSAQGGSGKEDGAGGGGGGSRKRANRRAPPFIVMELLRGEDMSEIRHRQASAPRVHPRVAVHLGKEMFRLLRRLHGLGIVHRDVKPNNFMRKSRADTEFWVIDFGLSKQLLNSSGEMKAERASAEFRGTTMYAPLTAHQGKDISFRDDLQSATFVFLDLLLGKLPWFHEARAKDKARVLAMKQELVADPSAAIEADPVLAQVPHKEQLIASLAKLLAHLAALRFGDRPDYDLCLALFDAMAFPGQEDLACLPPPAFDWLGEAAAAGGGSAGTATSGYQRAKQEEAGLNAGARQLLLSKQVLALCDMDGGDGAGAGAGGAATGGGGSGGGGKGKRDSLGFFKNASPPPPLPSPPGASSGGGGEVVGTAGAGGGLPEIELARMWARVGRRLVEQEAEEAEDGGEADAGEEGVARRVEQLVKCLAVARRHGTFFLVDGLTEREFADIQLEAVYGVERAYSRAKKKRQKLSGVVGGSSGGSTGDGRESSGGHRHKH